MSVPVEPPARLLRAARGCAPRSTWRRYHVALAMSLLLGAGPAAAQPQSTPTRARPEYRWLVESSILGAGGAAFLVGAALDTDVQPVPATGLDPSTIRLGIDRDVIGHHDTDADAASNGFRDVAVVYPVALAWIEAPGGERWGATLERAGLYAESLLLAHGVIYATKIGVSRPRPFTYLPASAVPDHSKYRVDADRAFQSMPSGHAASVWCATGFAITDHLISHPEAGWLRHAAVAFTGAMLASTTSTLRVEAGQHFPTDAMVGGLIGAASGAGVPLLHRWFVRGGRAPLPSGHAWLQSGGGLVLGAGAGLLLSSAFEH